MYFYSFIQYSSQWLKCAIYWTHTLLNKKIDNPDSDLFWRNSVWLATEVLRCRSKEKQYRSELRERLHTLLR